MSKKSNLKCLRFLGNVSENTRKSYLNPLRQYEEFHKMSCDELIKEALDEQTERVPEHQLTIISRLEDFQDHLIEKELIYGTIKEYMTKIKSIYHKNRVYIPYIEPLNPKQVKRREYIEYKDVLTKEELKKALQFMKPTAKARALVMIQGGLSNEECEHLTTTQFLSDLYQYHQCEDKIEALQWLADENNPVIWVARLIRKKTGKPYYALIGAEAVNAIANAKLYEKELPSRNFSITEKLLTNSKVSFGRICRDINKKCGFGLVADESKFRSHNLRRFHATYIKGGVLSYEENSLLNNYEIDELQGRGKTNVQDTYIKSDPIKQKLLYAKVMNNLSLWHKYDYEILDDDVRIFVVDEGKENRKLQIQVDELHKKLDAKEKASKKVKELRKELGNDVFDDIIAGILNAS